MSAVAQPHWTRALVRRMRHWFWSAVFRPQSAGELVLFGSEYGGWLVPRTDLPYTGVVLSFGVGTDASFDLSLIDATGCTVHAFDPTPISRAWVEDKKWPSQFLFHPYAFAGEDGTLKLLKPPIEGHVSFYAPKYIDSAQDSIEVPALSMNSIFAKLELDGVDICKMDIEGSEYDVIATIEKWVTYPRILLVEFHHGKGGHSFRRRLSAIRRIERVGYKKYYVSRSGREFGFRLV